jgi:hypothetical protein
LVARQAGVIDESIYAAAPQAVDALDGGRNQQVSSAIVAASADK